MKQKESVTLSNMEIKENTLILDLKSDKETTCSIIINNEQTLTTKINGKYHYEHSLKLTIDNRLDIKIQTDENTIEQTIERDMNSYFEGLKRTMIGKEDYFFLVNDKNEEIRQHYDKNFTAQIDYEKFKKSIKSKRTFLKNRGIKYNLFVIPDKSVVLREYLPFKTDEAYRHVDQLKDYVIDLKDIMTKEDYLKNDTHITNLSSLKIVPYIISKMHNENYEKVREEITKHISLKEGTHLGDLFTVINWSFNRNKLYHKNLKIPVQKVILKDDCEEREVPYEFRYISIRESEHIYNPDSISDKKVLIIRDSSTIQLTQAIFSYYREVFLYWDHWIFNKDLIDYYKPDYVIEIRTERFLNLPKYPMIDEDYKAIYPKLAKITNFDVNLDELKLSVDVYDYRQIPVDAKIQILIDDERIKTEEIKDGKYELTYPMTNYENGEYTLKLIISTENYKDIIIEKEFSLFESMDHYFEGLKSTFMGKDNVLFHVNDKTQELKQHYDRMYESRFDTKKFRDMMKSKYHYFKEIGKNYKFYLLPDKSIVLNEYLPFPNNANPIRHIDSINEYVTDLIDVIDEEDYLKNDTKISKEATIKIVAYILHDISKEKEIEEYTNELLNKLKITPYKHRGNLVTKKSWSYDEKLRDKLYFYDSLDVKPMDEYAELDNEEIPLEFREFSNHKSRYIINPNSISEEKLLFLHDTNTEQIVTPLITYYREIFLYDDKGFFNKALLEWFNPDLTLEIRGENTLENSVYQIISSYDQIYIPLTVKEMEFDTGENLLSYAAEFNDLRKIPVECEYIISIDDLEVEHKELDNGRCHFKYDISDLNKGEHTFKIHLDKGRNTKPRKILKKFST